jgi:hypothetical protein
MLLFKLGLEGKADSPGIALAVGYPADIGRVEVKFLGDAGEKPSL